MPDSVVVDERRGTLPKSLSDTEVVAPQLQRSQSARGLFIEDICATEGGEGDRLWLLLANPVEHAVSLSFTLGEHGVPAEEVVQRETLITFTVPSLPFTQDRCVQLRLESQNLHLSIPFTYKAKVETPPAVLLDSLAEFAVNGDITSLITPFSRHIEDKDSEGNTVLHISAKNSQNFSLKLLLSAIPEERKDEVVNIRNIRGQTPLHCAVRAGDPDSVHYLLRHGASTKILDNHKNSVIHYLADAYNEAIFKEILEAPSSQENDLDALNEEGFAPLHLAVRRLKLSLIEMLLEAGASINSLDQAGRSVLLHAVNMNDFEIVQLLLGCVIFKKGADPNVEDEFGETSLLLCMKTANYGIMGLLIDAGADPKKQNKDGNSLVMSGDETAQRIISGERVELPAKEMPPPVPNDLTTTRSALFGRSVSNAQRVRGGSSGRIHCTHKGSASHRPDLQHPQQSSATTQSQYGQFYEFILEMQVFISALA
uniref:ANK_REP_REGION domain-containing protein n=1 Tax=Angiostrongylus cantonensis TaxID=6313 RepID=A0A0K0DL49_ANGCA